ncbi:MAG TPA: PIN domain-containing protein [Candidatus Dormibacteraeota bacterium]|nr:PIN domain-containing protein [Candidatus Dormibacteraeota bacterium]
MPFLLDTSALFELTKRKPHGAFLDWLARQSAAETYIGAPSIGELDAGVLMLAASPKRTKLERWLAELSANFSERILPFDLAAARAWGVALAAARVERRTLPILDSQLAAIAFTRRLTVVTRNLRAFQRAGFPGLAVVDPSS